MVERNLRRAKDQSKKVVFDTRRIKRVPDMAIYREIIARAPKIKDLEKVIFINRHRECIDIYNRKK